MRVSETVFVPLPTASIYLGAGPDLIRYLHGRVTQDVKSLAVGAGARSFVLTTNGRVQGKFTVLRTADGLLVVSDPLAGDEAKVSFRDALLQFKVADQFDFDEQENLLVIDIRGANTLPLVAQACGHSVGTGSGISHEEIHIGSDVARAVYFEDQSVPVVQLVVSKPAAERVMTELLQTAVSFEVRHGTAEDRLVSRVLAAEPEIGAELTEKTLAPEVDVRPYVSFTKGCYAGQEVVEMATARGRPNRMLHLIRVEGSAPLIKSRMLTTAEAPEKAIGELCSSFVSVEDDCVYALTFVKVAHESDALAYEGRKASFV